MYGRRTFKLVSNAMLAQKFHQLGISAICEKTDADILEILKL